MRVLKVLLGCLCLLMVGTASATAAPVKIATTQLGVGPAAVDGSNVFYIQRANANAGYPIAIHHFDMKTGTDTVIRSITDHDVAIKDLRAGAGRVAYVEVRTNLAEQNFPERVLAMDPNGANVVEVFAWTFPIGDYGAPVGGLDADWIRDNGEVIVRKMDTVAPGGSERLTLIGVRRDGTSRKLVSSTQKVRRVFSYSDNYFAWTTMHKLVVSKFDGGKKIVRAVKEVVIGAAVDGAGRVLLNKLITSGNGGATLSIYANAADKNPKVLRQTASYRRAIPAGHFCGSRILINYPSGNPGVSRSIREINADGKVTRSFYSGKPGKDAIMAADLSCDTQTVSWGTMKNTGAPPAVPYTIFAQSLGN